MIIRISDYCDFFAEDKDSAREIREKKILPTLKQTDQSIIIDFTGIDSSTQSFIHALISEVFQKFGEEVLRRIQFKKCNRPIKSLVTTVINYSLE